MRRKLYLVAYDVRHPRRLAAAVRVVRGFASGGQKSAYECWLTDAEHVELMSALEDVLDLAQDAVASIPLDPRAPVTVFGKAVPPADPEFFYVA